jgi:hypothetical protein
MALLQLMRPSLRKGAHAALSSAAWQEIRVRSGRDDKGEGGALKEDWLVAERTAGPSTSVGMTLLFGVEVCKGRFGKSEGRTADPSTTLRSGRDDNSVWVRTPGLFAILIT